LVFFGTEIAELRKHPFPNLFPLSFRIKTVIFSQSGLNAKSMPDKTKIGSVYIKHEVTMFRILMDKTVPCLFSGQLS